MAKQESVKFPAQEERIKKTDLHCPMLRNSGKTNLEDFVGFDNFCWILTNKEVIVEL